jgi:integrase
MYLHEIDQDIIEEVAKTRERSSKIAPATVNRLLALIKTVLKRAHEQWKWLEKRPYVRMRVEPKQRVRWLYKEQANLVLAHLPPHLAQMVRFALATGLRTRNIVGLEWSWVDLERKYLIIPSEFFKNKEDFGIPLNDEAIRIILEEQGKHSKYVFTYKNNEVKSCNTKAWRKALAASGIENFRFHDLRHTWATWFLIAGGTLHELMGLGGWLDIKSVMRYAHWAKEYLRKATNRLDESINDKEFV